jgi:hypothetical protein
MRLAAIVITAGLLATLGVSPALGDDELRRDRHDIRDLRHDRRELRRDRAER